MPIPYNPQIVDIVAQLEQIPFVAQVRVNYLLNHEWVAEYGSDAVVFACMFQQPAFVGTDTYNKFWTAATELLYDNTNYNGSIVKNMAYRLEQYFSTPPYSPTSVTTGVGAAVNGDQITFTYLIPNPK